MRGICTYYLVRTKEYKHHQQTMLDSMQHYNDPRLNVIGVLEVLHRVSLTNTRDLLALTNTRDLLALTNTRDLLALTKDLKQNSDAAQHESQMEMESKKENT